MERQDLGRGGVRRGVQYLYSKIQPDEEVRFTWDCREIPALVFVSPFREVIELLNPKKTARCYSSHSPPTPPCAPLNTTPQAAPNEPLECFFP